MDAVKVSNGPQITKSMHKAHMQTSLFLHKNMRYMNVCRLPLC